jgi:hypothetical protein
MCFGQVKQNVTCTPVESEEPVSGPMFEPGTSRLRRKIANRLAVTSLFPAPPPPPPPCPGVSIQTFLFFFFILCLTPLFVCRCSPFVMPMCRSFHQTVPGPSPSDTWKQSPYWPAAISPPFLVLICSLPQLSRP